MITSKDQYVLSNAKNYFREHLCAGDYYSESRQVAGQWYGVGAAKLGLSGGIQEGDFLALCEGKRPDSLHKLTQRTCSKNRRIFSDFVISCPKSVSLLGLMVDERIVELHNKCVLLALEEVESFAAARVRAAGQNTHRTTKNLLVGLFHHDTSRALDPMIHSHCVIFNATHDFFENKWKALEKVDMLRSIRYINSVYEHELCRGLRKLGYQIEVGENKQFEIAGLTRELIEKFSKRHLEIVEKAQVHLQEKGLTARNLSALSEQVRLDTRQRKAPLQEPQKLKSLWEDQLTESEKQMLRTAQALAQKPAEQTLTADAQQAITFAKNHWFERNTTAQDYELWAVALERYRSEDFSVNALKVEFQKLAFLQNAQNTREVTTEETLATEAFLVKTTQEGAGQRPCICKTFRPIDQTLAEKQDWKTYQPGMLINFFSTYGKIQKGSICTISKVLLDGIEVQYGDKKHLVSFRYAQRWQRVEERHLEITQGEQLQMKSNLMSSNGVLLANGERVTLLEKTQDALVLQKEDGQTAHLAAKNAILDYGYAVTSYASQGKTVDKVILWDSGSLGASSLEQWYVSLSRGRKAACILTQNAQDLKERIVGSCGQNPAIERHWQPLSYQRTQDFGLDEKKIQEVVQGAFEHKNTQSQEEIEAKAKILSQKILLLQKEQQEVCEQINNVQHEEYLAACEVYREQFTKYCNNRSGLKKSLHWMVGTKQVKEPTMPKIPQSIGIKALEENFTTLQQKFPLIESIKGSFEAVKKLQEQKKQLEELLPKKQAMTLEKRQEQSMGWRR